MANKKVRKTFGENPEKIAVLDQVVEFDEQGEAEVDEAVAEVLEQLPGYEFEAEEAPQDDTPPKDEEPKDETPEEPTKPAPTPKKKPAPKKPAPKATPKA